MQSLKRNLIRLTPIFLVLELGCAIPKPEGKIGVAHTLSLPAGVNPYLHFYDFQSDFDDEFNIIPGHDGNKKSIKLEDLDKYVCVDATSYANSKAYWKKLKKRYEEMKATCGLSCAGY